MSAKNGRARLSKGILEMKFMQRTKAKVDKEIEEAEGREMYSHEITEKMLHNNSNFVLEPSFAHCENLVEGRLSFRGMNPEIERLLELEQSELDAAKRHEQPKDISDQDMAALYYPQQKLAASRTMHKKFQNNQTKRNSGDETTSAARKKIKFHKPLVEQSHEQSDNKG